MKKYILLLFILILTFSNCEKDDICIEDTTPSLIVRFYDSIKLDTIKEVEKLTVWAMNKDSIYSETATDSIVIPLDLSENSTTYKFQSDTTIDEITFSYNKNDVFVSRSSGYKTVFENLAVQTSNNCIISYNINNTTIENETNAHINIYH